MGFDYETIDLPLGCLQGGSGLDRASRTLEVIHRVVAAPPVSSLLTAYWSDSVC